MKPFVLIAGMHRSGTSFLVRALNLSGLYLGELEQMISTEWDFRADNLRGHWEHKKLLELGEKTLSQNKGTWDSIPEKITINDGIGNQIKEYADKLMITPSLAAGFKDPRIIINYESWLKYLPENIIVVGIFRDPLKVAESLKIRNGFSYEKSLNLWLQYNTKLLEIVKDGGFLLNFDWPVDRLLSEMDIIIEKLGLVKNANLSDWYSSELLKSNKLFDSKYNIPKEIQVLYTQLKEKSEKNQLIEVQSNDDKSLNKILENSISQNYLLGSYFRNINNKNLEKIKKHEENLSELKTQNKKINEEISELKNNQNEFLKQPLWKLIQIYLDREDLKKQFPEVKIGDYDQLISWASKVVSKEIKDNALNSLKPISDWISKEYEIRNESKEDVMKEYEIKIQSYLKIKEELEVVKVDNEKKIEELEVVKVDNEKKVEELEFARKRNYELEAEIDLIKNSSFYNTGQYVINFLDRNFPVNRSYGKITRKILMKIFKNNFNEKVEKGIFEYKYEFDEFIDNPIDEIRKLEFQPKISIIMPVFNTNVEFLKKAIESVKNQYYSNWQLCICDDASTNNGIIQILKNYADEDKRICVIYSEKNQGIGVASNNALKIAEGEFTILLDHDDMLTRNALLEIVKEINTDRSVDYIYSDEDKINEKGFHVEPFFKPDWSPNMFFSYNYPIHVSVFQTSKLKEINGFRKGFDGSQDYDLILRYLEHSKKIKHIPKILYSWRKSPGSTALRLSEKNYAFDAGIKAITDALSRRKIDAVCTEGIQKGTYHVQYKIKDSPLVSIIIPTKNLENLKKCIKSIFEKSTYQNYEIIVLDTSSENKIEKFCDSSKSQYLKMKLGKFNFSKINNDGVKKSKGKYIIFLNDDTEVISPEWIEGMLEHVQRDKVGIAGAKLLYKNDLVQHAGTIVGIQGHAGNYGMMHKDEGGNFSFAKIIRDYSAVTAACMMISKELFDKLNGYDEKLANSWQDVDLCLRVVGMNKEIIFTPYSLLYHYEGTTRGKDDASDEEMEARKIFREKHKEFLLKGDPHYNLNLSSSIPFALSPMLTKPKKVIADLYQRREDLRIMFPNEQKNNFKNMIDWAVTHGIVVDGEKYLLKQYYDYYYENCSENAKKLAKKMRMYLHSKELQEKFPEVFNGNYDNFLKNII